MRRRSTRALGGGDPRPAGPGPRAVARRLTRRGVTVPAGLLVAGAACEAEAAVPASLIHSTVRVALGFMAGNAAATLAGGSEFHAARSSQVRGGADLPRPRGGYGAWQAMDRQPAENPAASAPAVVESDCIISAAANRHLR